MITRHQEHTRRAMQPTFNYDRRGHDAVTVLTSDACYRQQLVDAQWRCDINGTTELVQQIDQTGTVLRETSLEPRNDRKVVRNSWR